LDCIERWIHRVQRLASPWDPFWSLRYTFPVSSTVVNRLAWCWHF
jgi:hypothetical protein